LIHWKACFKKNTDAGEQNKRLKIIQNSQTLLEQAANNAESNNNVSLDLLILSPVSTAEIGMQAHFIFPRYSSDSIRR
jgi:hypothetical protein